MKSIDFSQLIDRLKQNCIADTSAHPDGWSRENPLWGHCVVASLIAQDLYGGNLVRGSLGENVKYAHLKSHYWNQLPDGTHIDFTGEQYSEISFNDLVWEISSREAVLEHPDTSRRYELLKIRMAI